MKLSSVTGGNFLPSPFGPKAVIHTRPNRGKFSPDKHLNQFPLIRIAANKTLERGGVAIVINVKTTQDHPTILRGDNNQPGNHVLFKDPKGRLIICGVRYHNIKIIVGCIYAPAVIVPRLDQFRDTTNLLNPRVLPLGYDIIGSNQNETVSSLDYYLLRPLRSVQNKQIQRLISKLRRNQTLVDRQRERYLTAIAFSFFARGQGILRIDRILIREDQIRDIVNQGLKPSGLLTNYYIIEYILRLERGIQRGPSRQRLNPIILHLYTVRKIYYNALELLLGEDPFLEQ